MSYITEMVQDAISVHDRECCTETTPCSTRQRLNQNHGVGGRVTEPEDTFRSGSGDPYRNRVSSRPVPKEGATDKQVSFLKSLISDRDYLSLVPKDRDLVTSFTETGKISKKDASHLIGELKNTVRKDSTSYSPWTERHGGLASKATPETAKKVDDGFYILNDTIIKVITSRNGRQYGKVLSTETHSFEYAGARVLRGLTEEHRLTLEKARAYGQLYGICCRCGATLTDETSIQAGIGPICASKGF